WIDDTIASAIGYRDSVVEVPTNKYFPHDVMDVYIAYTGVDSKGPIGTNAIRAFFSDANDLGAVVGGDYSAFFNEKVYWTPSILHPLAFKDVKNYLGDVLVEYAGALAFNNDKVKNGVADLTKGVLALSNNNSVLSLDTSSVLWKNALGLDAKLDPVHIKDFREAFFKQIDSINNIDTSALYWLFGSTNLIFTGFDDVGLTHLAKLAWDANTADIFDRFHMAATDNGGDITLSERTYDVSSEHGDNTHVNVFIGNSSGQK